MKFITTIILCNAVYVLEKVDASVGNVHTFSLDPTDDFCEGDKERCKVSHCLNISSFDSQIYVHKEKKKIAVLFRSAPVSSYL